MKLSLPCKLTSLIIATSLIVSNANAGIEPVPSGSFIINMGVSPQTYANGIKPWGMIYDLIHNYKVQINWVISQTKIKDGKDFTYNGVDYKGGPFIIPAKYISSTIKQRITLWEAKGMKGVYTTATVDVPVYSTLSVMPTMTIDNSAGKEGIIIGYFNNALAKPSIIRTLTNGRAASWTKT